jgi:hypothetical protein
VTSVPLFPAVGVGRFGISVSRLHSEQVAAIQLNREGIEAIWELHLMASRAYRDGNVLAAAYIVEIADAAEREWARRCTAQKNGRAWR